MPDWVQILALLISVPMLVSLSRRHEESKRLLYPPVNRLEGLRGWLYLVGIGVVNGPIATLAKTMKYYDDLKNDTFIVAYTSPEGARYSADFALWIDVGLVVNILMVLASLYLVYLFFKKKILFPKLYIALFLIETTVLLVEPLATMSVFPKLTYSSFFDQEMLASLGGLLVWIFVWGSYMLVSKRVKATFTNV